jgi:hypothetical protein
LSNIQKLPWGSITHAVRTKIPAIYGRTMGHRGSLDTCTSHVAPHHFVDAALLVGKELAKQKKPPPFATFPFSPDVAERGPSDYLCDQMGLPSVRLGLCWFSIFGRHLFCYLRGHGIRIPMQTGGEPGTLHFSLIFYFSHSHRLSKLPNF